MAIVLNKLIHQGRQVVPLTEYLECPHCRSEVELKIHSRANLLTGLTTLITCPECGSTLRATRPRPNLTMVTLTA